MTRPNRLRPTVLLAAIILLAGATPAAAQSYQDKTHHFSVDLPDGWEVIPPDELRQVNATLRKYVLESDASLAAAFRPIGSKRGAMPVVVAHVDGEMNNGVPFEQFERQFGRNFEAARARKRSGRQIRTTMARPVYDRERKRATFAASVTQEDGGPIGMYTVYALGPDGAVVLTGYADAETFRDHVPAFVATADSVRFEEPPAPTDYLSALDRLVGRPVGEYGRMAIVGGVSAAVVLLVGMVAWRGTPAPRRVRV